jgi:serine/threonine-protein kinase
MKNVLDAVSVDFNSFIGREIGYITILKELGRGNRGVVFVAFQKSLKRQVAVKILPKVCATTGQQQQQFRDEAEIIAVLSHPNIIPIFEMGEEKDFYYHVMQLIVGKDLDTIIANHLKHPVPTKRLLPLEETLEIIIQVLDGINYAHEEGVVHQDIKPSNILMEERTKRPLIADFGIAKTVLLDDTMQKGFIVGSPTYMSPEQAAGRQTGKQTDVYSVGILLLKMLAGKLPVRKESVEETLVRKIKEPETFITALPSDVSPLINKELERIILKSIKTDLVWRYQDCSFFREELLSFRDNYTKR